MLGNVREAVECRRGAAPVAESPAQLDRLDEVCLCGVEVLGCHREGALAC